MGEEEIWFRSSREAAGFSDVQDTPALTVFSWRVYVHLKVKTTALLCCLFFFWSVRFLCGKTDVDVTSVVRKSVGEVRNHLDELIRVLNKQHHEIQVYVHLRPLL